MQMLVSTMQADRAKDAARINISMQSELSAYPMYQARNDLLQYFYDGTLTHALAQADQNASATAQKCQAANSAVSAAVQSSGSAALKSAALTMAPAAQTTTSDQCNQIADAVSFKFDTSKTTADFLALVAPGGKLDKSAYAAANACVENTPTPEGFDLKPYTLAAGSYDLPRLMGDQAIDTDYKKQILTCTQSVLKSNQKPAPSKPLKAPKAKK